MSDSALSLAHYHECRNKEICVGYCRQKASKRSCWKSPPWLHWFDSLINGYLKFTTSFGFDKYEHCSIDHWTLSMLFPEGKTWIV